MKPVRARSVVTVALGAADVPAVVVDGPAAEIVAVVAVEIAVEIAIVADAVHAGNVAVAGQYQDSLICHPSCRLNSSSKTSEGFLRREGSAVCAFRDKADPSVRRSLIFPQPPRGGLTDDKSACRLLINFGLHPELNLYNLNASSSAHPSSLEAASGRSAEACIGR
jgi:hypothetical protein